MKPRNLTICGFTLLIMGVFWLGSRQIKLSGEVKRLNQDLVAATAAVNAEVNAKPAPPASPNTVRIAGAESMNATPAAAMQRKIDLLYKEVGQLRVKVARFEEQPSRAQSIGSELLGEFDMGMLEALGNTISSGRRWGEEQAVGEPDTHQHGDLPTAWAPKQPDGGEEWLQVDFEKSVPLAEINVHETLNPGAIRQVAAIMPDGSEKVIWEGEFERDEGGRGIVERAFQVQDEINAKQVKIYMDTTRVSGWNEIDAVELVGADDSRQWASASSASSSFAE